MRVLGLAVVLVVIAVTPVAAQIGLTPSAQVGHLCQRAMQFRARGFGDGTAINDACGSGAALAATIAAGRSGLDSLLALIVTARVARDTALQSGTP